MTDSARETLIEAAATAYRDRDLAGRILPSPAWMDLPPADRERAFEAQASSRLLEAAWDEEGLSATAREVLRRVPGLRQIR